MNGPFIIDAGPALNFIAAGYERLLTNALANRALQTPEAVEKEVLRKASNPVDRRFIRVRTKLPQMQRSGYLTVLADDLNDLTSAAEALSATSRRTTPKDLGETMVVLHAYALALQGTDVTVIIDDAGGVEFAKKAFDALSRVRAQGKAVGRFGRTGTIGIIERRLNTVSDIPNHEALRTLWGKISPLDDGLPNDLTTTGLLAHPAWTLDQRP